MSQHLAEDGDIELVVGDQKKHIRVYSFLMKLVSKPFGALLGPNFKEGQASVPAGQPKEIHLPDDDATAMETICMVVHHRGNVIHGQENLPAPELLLNIALLADKYDCMAAMCGYASTWISHNSNEGRKTTELVQTLTAAFTFDDPCGFAASSEALVKYHIGPFNGILTGPASLILPPASLGKSYHIAARETHAC